MISCFTSQGKLAVASSLYLNTMALIMPQNHISWWLFLQPVFQTGQWIGQQAFYSSIQPRRIWLEIQAGKRQVQLLFSWGFQENECKSLATTHSIHAGVSAPIATTVLFQSTRLCQDPSVCRIGQQTTSQAEMQTKTNELPRWKTPTHNIFWHSGKF